MYSMLIAEDEALERRAFKSIVMKDVKLITDVVEAQNGNEAVALASKQAFDIIVMDLKMPGMNGLEAIKKMKNSGSKAHFLILTAYDDFDYINDALKMGVDDYLLKPSRRAKIVDTLNKTIGIIEAERKKVTLSKIMLDKVEQIRPTVENQLVSLCMFRGSSNLEIKSCLDFLSINETKGYMMIINAVYRQEDDNIIRYITDKEIYNEIYDFLHKNHISAVSMPLHGNIAAVIFGGKEGIENKLHRALSTRFERGFYIGVGDVFENISEMEKSYYQSLRALRNAIDSDIEVVNYHEQIGKDKFFMSFLLSKEEVLLRKVKALNERESLETVDEMFLWIFKNLSDDFIIAKNYIMGLVALLMKDCSEMVVGKKVAIDFLTRDCYSEISNINDLWNLKAWLEGVITEAVREIESVRKDGTSKIIDKAKVYIEENYKEDLTLDKMAIEVNMSTTYFSRLFKEATGQNFVDFVSNVRVSRAKALLEKTDYNIKQIAYQVGYNDANYFSKVFKKITGVSPGSYR
jgi:two-component system, response regulator YesN